MTTEKTESKLEKCRSACFLKHLFWKLIFKKDINEDLELKTPKPSTDPAYETLFRRN